MDGHPVGPGGERHLAGDRRQQVLARPAGPPRSLCPCADLRPRQRLPEGLVRRYRRTGEGGPAARRDRGARPRPAAAAGQGGAGQRPGGRDAGRGDGATLADAGRDQHGGQADRRREDRRPHGQAGADQGGQGQCRSARSARRLQAPDRAVRRHRDHPQHRCRRAHQRRFERRPCPVRHLRHAEAQGQCQHPAELRAGGEAQHQGADHRARVSRQDLLRRRRGLGARRRCRRAARRACSSWSTTAPAS